jgi:hypothetical protein
MASQKRRGAQAPAPGPQRWLLVTFAGTILVGFAAYLFGPFSAVMSPQTHKLATRTSSSSSLMPHPADVAQQRKWAREVNALAKHVGLSATITSDADRQKLVLSTTGAARQIRMLRGTSRGGKYVPTIVHQQPGRGLGVFYAGDETLPKDSLVLAWRCLFVREDQVDEWISAGLLDNTTTTVLFWSMYVVQYQVDDEEFPWIAFPVGELPGERWHSHAALSEEQITHAVRALNARALPDWTTGVHRGKEARANEASEYYPYLGHLANEPSVGEPVTLSKVKAPRGCASVGEGLRVCGAILESWALRDIEPGEALTWCYGKGYNRSLYTVSEACVAAGRA